MKTIVEVEHLQSGQSRPYADSIYAAYITVQGHGAYTDGSITFHRIKEDEAKELARRYVEEYKDNPEWHEPALKECTPVGLSEEQLAQTKWKDNDKTRRWYVKIIRVYLD